MGLPKRTSGEDACVVWPEIESLEITVTPFFLKKTGSKKLMSTQLQWGNGVTSFGTLGAMLIFLYKFVFRLTFTKSYL